MIYSIDSLNPRTLKRFFSTLLLLLVFLMMQASSASASAAQSHSLPSLLPDGKRLALPEPVGVLVLPKNQAISPDDLLQSPYAERFVVWHYGMQLATDARNDVWLRLYLPIQSKPQSWLLRIPRLTLQKASLFQRSIDQPGTWQTQAAGISVPNDDWPMRSRDPIFEITTRSDTTQVFFIRLENSRPVTESPQLMSAGDYGDGARYAGGINGMILGVYTVLILAGMISWRMYRNSQFAWFALWMLVTLFTSLTASGYMITRVWSHSVFMAKIMGEVMAFASLMAFARFSLSVSYARDLSAIIFKSLWALIALCAVLIIAIVLTQAALPRIAMNIAFFLGFLYILFALARIAWQSQVWLWWIVISLIPISMTALARLAYNLTWLASADLALLLGVILFMLGSIGIYGTLLFHQGQRLAKTLRESEREAFDINTGLFAESVARERLPRFIARSKNLGKACGAILVRWVDCNTILADRSAVEKGRVFEHLGERLRRVVREIDTAARYGDDHFIFLLEAPVTRTQLNDMAIKILTSCMRPSPLLASQKGFDLHLALWHSADAPADAPQVLEMLNTRLSQMPDDTSKRVQFVQTPSSDAPPIRLKDAATASEIIRKINTLEAFHDVTVQSSKPPSL